MAISGDTHLAVDSMPSWPGRRRPRHVPIVHAALAAHVGADHHGRL